MKQNEIVFHDIALVPQDDDAVCWFASTMMMFQWRSSRGGDVPDPRDSTLISVGHRLNFGLPGAFIAGLAKAVKLKPKPPMTPTAEELVKWLRQGPLMVTGMPVDWNGKAYPDGGHAVVVAGIRSVPRSDDMDIYVYDPWPVKKGKKGWRPIRHLVGMMDRAGSAKAGSEIIFLSY